jgi:16S rRNA G966 N2-methylase RsmD
VRGDVAAVLRRMPSSSVFDVVVLDPPYDAAGVPDALSAAGARLAAGGVLVLERATRREPDTPAPLTRTRDVKSGDSTLTFYTISA